MNGSNFHLRGIIIAFNETYVVLSGHKINKKNLYGAFRTTSYTGLAVILSTWMSSTTIRLKWHRSESNSMDDMLEIMPSLCHSESHSRASAAGLRCPPLSNQYESLHWDFEMFWIVCVFKCRKLIRLTNADERGRLFGIHPGVVHSNFRSLLILIDDWRGAGEPRARWHGWLRLICLSSELLASCKVSTHFCVT